MSLYRELKRRNVFRVAIAYLAGAWLISEVATTLFPLFGFGETPARIVVILLAIGFPLFLIFSWVFEITPEGLKLEKDIERSVSTTHKTGKQLDRVIIVLLALALGYFAIDKFVLEPARVARIIEVTAETVRTNTIIDSIGDKSVAVLPFANRGLKPEDEYIADGIYIELLTRLSQISSLRVISRTSVEQFRHTELTAPEIGRELKVANILEGAVQGIGNQMRIHVQLIDAHVDRPIWSATYDRELTTTDLFAVQTEIAERVALTLKANLTSQEKKQVAVIPTGSLEAYQALLRGHQILSEGSVESVYQAIENYEQALLLWPDFAQAYVAMAEAYGLAADTRGISEAEALRKTEEFARKALLLDETLGLAYLHLGYVERAQGRLNSARLLYEQGLEYEPGNSRLLHAMGMTLRLAGQPQEAVPYYDLAIRLDPLSLIINESRGSLLRDLGLFDEAEKQYRNTLLIDPEYPHTYWGLGTLYWSMGKPGSAVRWFEKAIELTPHGDVFRSWLALMYLELCQDNLAIDMIEQTIRTLSHAENNDVVLIEELFRLYHGQELSNLLDGRQFMARYWYGSLLDLPQRALISGNFEQALTDYKKKRPTIFSEDLEINGTNYHDAIYVAYVFERLGERRRSEELLQHAEEFLYGIQRLGIHGYWVADAQIEAVRENPVATLALLNKAVNEGWRNLWRFYLIHDPLFDFIREDPEFQNLIVTVQAEIEKQGAVCSVQLH